MVFLIYGGRGWLPTFVRPTRCPRVKCMLSFEAYSESRQSVGRMGAVAVMVAKSSSGCGVFGCLPWRTSWSWFLKGHPKSC